MANNDDIAATITSDNTYQPGTGKADGPGRTYDRSTKILDVGKDAQPGANTPRAGFVNPDPGSAMLGSDWDKASR